MLVEIYSSIQSVCLDTGQETQREREREREREYVIEIYISYK